MSRIFYNRARAPFARFAPGVRPMRDAETRTGKRDKLDDLTSKIVRKRDLVCVLCRSHINLTASHFFSRQYLAIRFDLLNVACMCWHHNRAHNLNQHPYIGWIEKTYGGNVIPYLNRLRMDTRKVEDWELDQLIEQYESLERLSAAALQEFTMELARAA